MAYRMALVLVTLNDLKVIRWLQVFSSAIRRTFVQYFTRFKLTACSRGPSATAGLLIFSNSEHVHPVRTDHFVVFLDLTFNAFYLGSIVL